MAQTPAQRRANAKFAKSEEEKRGKPQEALKKKNVEQRSPIPKWLLVLFLTLIVGGVLVEVVRLFF